MNRLSYGERDAGDRGQQYLRDLFLHHTSEVPDVVESLIPGLTLPLRYGRLHFRESALIREFLTAWSKRWHLDAGWVRERAFEKLCFWLSEREEYRICDLGVGTGSAVSMTAPEGLPTYYTGQMTRSRYLELVRSTVTLKLRQDELLNRGDFEPFVESIVRGAESYCDAAERQWDPAATKQDLKRDIDWTIKFQIQGRAYAEIAAEDLPGIRQADDLVRKAVSDILKRIELPRRFVKRGRKQGSKNKYNLTELGSNKNVREI